MQIKVTYIPCLFDEESWIRFESHNQTVLSIFSFLFQSHPEVRDDPPCITVRINGKKIHPILWGKPLKDGDEVLVIQEIGWEAILIAVFGSWTAAVIASWAAVIIPIVSLGMTVLSIAYTIYSYCTAPEAPRTGRGLNSSPTYGWEGPQMQVRQGIPVPIVYGEHLVGGNLIEAYISSKGEKNYLNMLIALSEGEIEGIMKEDLSGVCSNLPEKASGTITMTGLPTANQTFIIDTQTFYWVDPADFPGRGAGYCWIGATTEECVFNLMAAINGDCSYSVNATKGAGNTVVVFANLPGTAGNSIDFSETSSNMAMDGSGHLGGTNAGVAGDLPHIYINDNLYSNYQDIVFDWRPGAQDQTMIPGFGNIAQTYSMGGILLTTTPYVYTTVDSDVEAFEARIRAPACFVSWRGDFFPFQIWVKVEHKLHSDSTYIEDGNIYISAISQDPLRRYFRVDNLTPGQYDIRLTQVYLDPFYVANNVSMVGVPYLDNIIEIKYDTLTYPHTSLLALTILATEKLSGMIPNVVTRIRGVKSLNLDTSATEWTNNPIYNVNNLLVNSRYGVGKYILQANINNDQLILMADHCDQIVGCGTNHCDLCNGVFDSADSTSLTDNDHTFLAGDVGHYISVKSPSDSTLYSNLLITSVTTHTATGSGRWKLSDGSDSGVPTPGEKWEWGEKRYQLDLVLDAVNPAFDCINQICSCFRALPLWNRDAIQLLIDKKESPSYLFSMGNVIEGSFSHTFGSEKSKPNSIDVDYADNERLFQKQTVEVTDYSAITGMVPKRTRRMSLLGASRQSQIYREARYHLYAAKYQDEQVGFKGGIDSIHMLPGDVVKFQHDVFSWGLGGRVVSATTTAVTVDQSITIVAGHTYSLLCKLTNDTVETRTINNSAGTYTVLTVSVAFTTAPPAFGIYTVGEMGVDVKTFRVMRISKTPQNEIEVSATEYSDSVYTDTGIVLAVPIVPPTPIEPPIPPIPPPLNSPPEVTNLVLTETTDSTGVSITYDLPSPLGNWNYGEILVSKDGGSTYSSLTTFNTDVPYIYRDVIAGGTYWVKIISFSMSGVQGAFPPTEDIVITGVAAVGITSLTTAVSFKSIFLNWVTVADTNVNKTEVWRANTNDRAGASLITSIFGTSYTDIITSYSTTRYYWVRNKNPNGVYSAWYPVSSTGGVSGTTEAEPGGYTPDTTPPGTPTGLGLTTGTAQAADGTEFSWLRATWTANSEGDLSHYEYRVKETGGNYIYGYVTANEILFQPVRGNILFYVGIRAIDKSGNKSAFTSDSSTTSAKDTTLPASPTSFAAVSSFKTIFLTWVNPTDKDFSHINIYYNTQAIRGSATLLAKIRGTFYAHDVGGYGETIYYWINSEDWSGNICATEAGPVDAAGAYIAAADIGTFAITASKIYTKIPIITGDTWTDNSPSAGYVAWSAHTLYYNGVAYSISASNTNLKYIYWLNTGTSYTKSDTNPVLTDGDFIIAVNISGAHDLAWNAIANQVIGSAYIQDAAIVNAKIGLLAVDDANINTLNASKINAGDIAAARMQVQGGNAINAGSVTIDPGKVLISGATTLSDWRHGTDATKIDGGDVYANSITANKISLGSRNLTIQGIEIAAQTPPSSKESLLHFNGTNGAATFTDEYGWTWTGYGTAQLSTTSPKFGTAKLLLDGTSDYIQSLDYTSLGSAFCIEGWFNTTDKTQQNQGIFSFVNAANYGLDLRFNYGGNNKLTLWASSNGTSWDIISAQPGANTTWSNGTWYKFRVEFTGTRYSVYVGTTTMSEDYGYNSTSVICAITSAILGANTTNYFYGGIDEVRVLIGRYRDGTTFTAETAELTEVNYLFWSSGVISYIQDAGSTTDVSIAQGNTLWTTGTLYLYWVKDAATLSTTTTRGTAFGAENIVLASYRGGSDAVVNYGRTIVDGSDIVTRTIKAEHLSVTELICNSAQIKNLTVTTIKIADNAATIPISAYTAGYVACAEDVYTTIQSCSITSTGAPIFCTWSFQVINDSASPNYMMFVMVDEHDSVKHSATVTFPGSASQWFCFNVTTTPAAEAKTYNVKVIPYDGTASVYSRSMMILECKK